MGVRVKEWDGGKGGKEAWWVLIDHRTKRKARRIGPGPEGRTAAMLLAERLNAQITLGDFNIGEDQRETLAQFAEAWPDTHVEHLMRRTARQQSEREVFTAPEVTLVLNRARQRDAMRYALVMPLACTGMCISEMLGLRLEDVDFERRNIHVRRTWGNQARGSEYHGTPKSGNVRLVDMSRQLADTLRAYTADMAPPGRPRPALRPQQLLRRALKAPLRRPYPLPPPPRNAPHLRHAPLVAGGVTRVC